MPAQYATAYNHGLDGQFVEYRAAQATRVDDWLWYEPNTEGMGSSPVAPPSVAATNDCTGYDAGATGRRCAVSNATRDRVDGRNVEPGHGLRRRQPRL